MVVLLVWGWGHSHSGGWRGGCGKLDVSHLQEAFRFRVNGKRVVKRGCWVWGGDGSCSGGTRSGREPDRHVGLGDGRWRLLLWVEGHNGLSVEGLWRAGVLDGARGLRGSVGSPAMTMAGIMDGPRPAAAGEDGWRWEAVGSAWGSGVVLWGVHWAGDWGIGSSCPTSAPTWSDDLGLGVM